MRILLASGNAKKREELTRLLAPLGHEVVTPREVGGLAEVEEDRDTFAGNAAKKASAAARAHGMWALADDSGLEVEALGGAPGVHSARWSGGGDEENNARLLRELDGLPADERGARFACALALAAPDGEIAAAIESHAAGRILSAARGTSGFGYDPLFQFAESDQPGAGRTFAELSAEEKARVSHRGRALRELARTLPRILAETGAG